MQNMPLYFKIEQGKNMDRNDWPDLSFSFPFFRHDLVGHQEHSSG